MRKPAHLTLCLDKSTINCHWFGSDLGTKPIGDSFFLSLVRIPIVKGHLFYVVVAVVSKMAYQYNGLSSWSMSL